MRKKIGLTGGIASGKSTVADMFASLGAYIVDADVLARRVQRNAPVTAALQAAFPSVFCGTELRRDELRRLVFNDAAALQTLNAIMHPPIFAAAEEALEQSTAPVTLLVAPLLFEVGLDRLVSETVTISCPEQMRIERLTKRDTISAALAERMIAAQLSDAEREARATTVLRNDGDVASLRAAVEQLFKAWTKQEENPD